MQVFVDGPFALGEVSWSPQRVTLVAKAAFRLRGDVFELDDESPPLSLDAFDAGGELVHPTDFAPFKPACDVVVAGPDVRERRHPGSLVAGALACSVETNESLGPRESFCPSGDPSDPEVHASWIGGAVDFVRFQAAGPRQRTPWVDGALRIELARPPLSLAARWYGAAPCLVLEAPGGSRHDKALALDTLLLFPSSGRMFAVWRTVVDLGAPGAQRAYVRCEVDGRAPGALRAVETVTPSSLRVRGEVALMAPTPGPDQTRMISGAPAVAWPFARDALKEDAGDVERTRTVMARTPARTLPFQEGVPRHDPHRSVATRRAPVELAALRDEGRHPVAPAWHAGEVTAPLQPSPAYADSVVRSEPPARAPTPPRAPEATPPERLGVLYATPTAVGEGEGGESDTVRRVQREIWKGERTLESILAEHGLTVAAWRDLRARRGRST